MDARITSTLLFVDSRWWCFEVLCVSFVFNLLTTVVYVNLNIYVLSSVLSHGIMGEEDQREEEKETEQPIASVMLLG